MTLLRELIRIPRSVGPADYVINAAESADLDNYVVTEQLAQAFDEALALIKHSLDGGRSQAKFLHGSFGSGKSHFMTVLRELLAGNPDARAIPGLGTAVPQTDSWLPGKKILCLSLHMLDADSVEQRLFEAYLKYCAAHHPEVTPAALHHSDAMLADAAALRSTMGDETFFAALGGSGVRPGDATGGLAAHRAQTAGWTPETFDMAAGLAPGTLQRDALVSALTVTFFSASVRSGRYLDLDTGLAVLTRHAQGLGYQAIVVFLDEFILWLTNRITDTAFVSTEGAKLNKLVESSDAARPIPLISFVAQQRLLTEFFGDQVAGTDRESIANIMRSAQGRLGTITLADTNLPAIAERRILKPLSEAGKLVIDRAFDQVRNNLDVWNVLLLGAQFNDAGIGSDAQAFRRLYPFSPALVATLVALSQALQRQRTAVKVMIELLAVRRDTLRVNDLIGASALFGPLVLHGELPDRPELKQRFQAARATYTKLRLLLLSLHGINEAQTKAHQQFSIDDTLIRTVLLGALVPEVPALHNLTALKLHALNFGSISAPIPGYEAQVVLDRLRRIAASAGELLISEDSDPIIRANLATVDYDRLLDLVPGSEETPGAVQRLIRDLVSEEMGFGGRDTLDDIVVAKPWRGRNHTLQVKFGNVRDKVTMPDAALLATGATWRIIIDYPMDEPQFNRRTDVARVEELKGNCRSVFWLPLFLTADAKNMARTLSKINYLVGMSAVGNRLESLAAEWSVAEREQGRIYLENRRQTLRNSLVSALRQAYGVSKPGADVEEDGVSILHSLAPGLRLGTPQGGTLGAAFQHLASQLLAEAYPGDPHLPDDEKPLTRGELSKVWQFAAAAAADKERSASVPTTADQNVLRRIVNRLRLGELNENRYALNLTTCWWSSALTQGAANLGYSEELPVSVLRRLMELDDRHWGFDPELQNLIIAVVALEQELAFFDRGSQVEITSVTQVEDRYILRKPRMPTADEWAVAIRRAGAVLGVPIAIDRNPATLKLGANSVQARARELRSHAEALVDRLQQRAGLLGLDVTGGVGRFATARLCRTFIADVAERDLEAVDVIRRLAEGDLGDLDLPAAGASLAQAEAVSQALGGTNWGLFDVAQTRNAEEGFREALQRLQDVAGRDQLAADLAAALASAQREVTRLLKVTAAPPSAGEQALHSAKPVGEGVAVGKGISRNIGGLDDLDSAVQEIRQALKSGKKVQLSWVIE